MDVGEYMIIKHLQEELFVLCPKCGYWDHQVGVQDPQLEIQDRRQAPETVYRCRHCGEYFKMRED